jgi:protocatechuate 3,4-dioxygenase beta subunit
MAGRTGLCSSARRALLALILAGACGVGAGTLAGGPAAAAAETQGTGSESTGATGSTGSNCPSSNSPNTITLVAGTPQSATLQTAFATSLQVALTNSDGCAVTGAAGTPVTFTAPSSGASGAFSASGSDTVTVGADASGAVAAPAFTANDIAGSYTVTASSQYGSVSFSLTNAVAGVPARIVAVSPSSQSAGVTGSYRQPLQVQVLDADGNPVAGTTVTFTLGGSGGAGSDVCETSSSAGASFLGGATQASETTGATGVASSPPFTANSAAGPFTATAALASSAGAGGSDSGTAAGSATPVSFALRNLAGKPAKLAPGVGATQSTPAGARFPIRLAVTATDAEGNRVPDALVTFSAPTRGPSGRFATRSHSRRRELSEVKVNANACGIAVAPPFTANRQQGGYVVEARAGHARAAAFALVNEAPGRQP